MAKKSIVFFGIKYFPSKGGTSRVVESLLWGLKDHFDITIYCYKNDLANHNIPGIKTIQFSEIPIKGIGVFLYYLRCCTEASLLRDVQYQTLPLLHRGHGNTSRNRDNSPSLGA